ncbi:hypothetical protein BDFB_001648 [Asbolus verrucosus]|uniref:Uncharacterized protein n=1 Tax=Asbolus verrucosus TaxID=1661398 RepID=A0A482VNN8_ASBVE|nr:hypothetical protein BDFB_001648 [Asbolus verrucosus]
MDSNAKDKIKGFFQKVPDSSSPDCAHVINCDSDLYLRRMVRLILNNAYLDKKDLVGYFTGHLNIKLSAKEYEFLVHFSQSDESKEEAFKEVNSIFEVAFQKTSFDQYKEMILTFEEELYFLIFNPTTGGLVSACLVLYITYKLLRARFTWKSILKYLIFINYVADFIITYLHIIQDEEINKMVNLKQLGTIPPECDPQKLSWWNYMKTHVGK